MTFYGSKSTDRRQWKYLIFSKEVGYERMSVLSTDMLKELRWGIHYFVLVVFVNEAAMEYMLPCVHSGVMCKYYNISVVILCPLTPPSPSSTPNPLFWSCLPSLNSTPCIISYWYHCGLALKVQKHMWPSLHVMWMVWFVLLTVDRWLMSMIFLHGM